MNRSEIIKVLKKKFKNGCEKDHFDYIIDVIKTNIHKGPVEIRGLGRFSLKKVKSYIMKNPKNKKTYEIPSRKKIYFKSGKIINDFINFVDK